MSNIKDAAGRFLVPTNTTSKFVLADATLANAPSDTPVQEKPEETQAEPPTGEDQDYLAFLSPSTKQGSLGRLDHVSKRGVRETSDTPIPQCYNPLKDMGRAGKGAPRLVANRHLQRLFENERQRILGSETVADRTLWPRFNHTLPRMGYCIT